MNGCRLSVDTEPTFAALGLRLRLDLAVALTEVARAWIDAPGLDLPDHAGERAALSVDALPAAWHVESARAPGDPYRLRTVIAEALSPPAFVAAAFRAVLGRAPDPAGLAYYTAWLGRDPACHRLLLENLAVSPEATGHYERFRFMRTPTPAEES